MANGTTSRARRTSGVPKLIRLRGLGRALPEADEEGLVRAVGADDLDLDLVARLVAGDRVGDVLRRGDLPAVDGGDDVAVADAGLVGGTAAGRLLDERALARAQPALARDALGHRARRHPEERADDRLAALEPRDDLAHGVGRDGEADADVAAARAAGLDLRVDPDHAPVRVEQGAARVARVDRCVGLDDLVDVEAVGRGDVAPEAGD